MKTRWTAAELDGPAGVAWELLTDPSRWPDWGPTVRSATVNGDQLDVGTRGSVVTVAGLRLPFEITAFEPGRRWSWDVAGVPATDHLVEPLGPDRCRVAFGVPWAAAPYLVVCRLALRRLSGLVVDHSVTRPA